MKIKKYLPLILIALVLLFVFLPLGEDAAPAQDAAMDVLESVVLGDDSKDDPSSEPSDSLTSEESAQSETAPAIDEHGSYDSKEDVALYIHTYGRLPDNYVTKDEAEEAGWSGGSVEKYLPGMCIGGSRFGNREGLLPDAPGRTWTECDINTLGASSRGAERIVFSNDGLIYYTGDHYESFEFLYG